MKLYKLKEFRWYQSAPGQKLEYQESPPTWMHGESELQVKVAFSGQTGISPSRIIATECAEDWKKARN